LAGQPAGHFDYCCGIENIGRFFDSALKASNMILSESGTLSYRQIILKSLQTKIQ